MVGRVKKLRVFGFATKTETEKTYPVDPSMDPRSSRNDGTADRSRCEEPVPRCEYFENDREEGVFVFNDVTEDRLKIGRAHV